MRSMVQAYNFLASWQLFPEKSSYENGIVPKSGIYRMEATETAKTLRIFHTRVLPDNTSLAAEYLVLADGEKNKPHDPAMGDSVEVFIPDGLNLDIRFYQQEQIHLQVHHEILPNGYLQLTQTGTREDGSSYTNLEIYHKQLSVLPYSASVSGAVIRPTKEGVIKHKALTAMEEQTNMQLEQIRKQIELLALQAHEIQKRKDLSLLIYDAKLSFKPQIGQTYYLYERKDGTHLLSLVSPKEWGASGPFKQFLAAVQLLADHTWKEL
jgi:hypothetical protein